MNIVMAGMMPYDQALDLQLQLLARRQQDLIDDTLLLLEHPPVLTLGTRGNMEHIYCSQEQLDEAGVAIFKVGRGGDVTYHGPGQLIVYPIVKLYHREGGIRVFIEKLEQSVMQWLAESFQIESSAGQGKLTGIWVNDAKIMAVGLAVKQGVTMHGLALNLKTDLTPFTWINPCGLNKPVTSLHLLTDQPFDFDQTAREIGCKMADLLGDEAVWLSLTELQALLDKPEIDTTEKDESAKKMK